MDMTRYFNFINDPNEDGDDDKKKEARVQQILTAMSEFKRVLGKVPQSIGVRSYETVPTLPEGMPEKLLYMDGSKMIAISIIATENDQLLGHDFALVYVDPVRHNR